MGFGCFSLLGEAHAAVPSNEICSWASSGACICLAMSYLCLHTNIGHICIYDHKLEKEMATHASILAGKILWTEEPGGLLSMGSQSRTRLKRLSSSSSMAISDTQRPCSQPLPDCSGWVGMGCHAVRRGWRRDQWLCSWAGFLSGWVADNRTMAGWTLLNWGSGERVALQMENFTVDPKIPFLFSFFCFFLFAGSSLLCRLFCSCSSQGLLSSWGALASHCGGFSCWGAWALEWEIFGSCGSQVLEHRLNSCGAWVQLLCGIRDFPRPGIKPLSTVLAGRVFTTEPGKSPFLFSFFKLH